MIDLGKSPIQFPIVGIAIRGKRIDCIRFFQDTANPVFLETEKAYIIAEFRPEADSELCINAAKAACPGCLVWDVVERLNLPQINNIGIEVPNGLSSAIGSTPDTYPLNRFPEGSYVRIQRVTNSDTGKHHLFREKGEGEPSSGVCGILILHETQWGKGLLPEQERLIDFTLSMLNGESMVTVKFHSFDKETGETVDLPLFLDHNLSLLTRWDDFIPEKWSGYILESVKNNLGIDTKLLDDNSYTYFQLDLLK